MAIIGFRVSNDGSRVRKFAMLECRNRLQRDPAALGTMRGSRVEMPQLHSVCVSYSHITVGCHFSVSDLRKAASGILPEINARIF